MPRIPQLACFLTSLLLAAWLVAPLDATRSDTEVRGLWVVRTSLGSPASIARLVGQARDAGFNALFVQVRGRGDAYFSSTLEPRAAALAGQPATFDPLADLLRAAHAARMRVHAWVNVNLVASAVTLPAARNHLVQQHPDWLMVPRDLAVELGTLSPRNPAYVGRIARWTRAQLADVEGLYASPIHPGAAAHAVAVVADLVQRYPVDGVHLDYVRYPRGDFDYGPAAMREFRASLDEELAPAEARRLAERARTDPLVFADTFPVRWTSFRRSRLTALVMRMRTAVKSARPDALVSAAVVPDAVEAAGVRLQDWGLWAQTGLLDAVCPMAYTPDLSDFARQVSDAARTATPGALWAGIGAYKLDPAQALAQIQEARRAGSTGYVLFSYDSMTDPSQPAADYLEQVGRAALDAATLDGGMR